MLEISVIDNEGNLTSQEVDWDGIIEQAKLEHPYIFKYQNATTYYQKLVALKGLYLDCIVPHNDDGRCNDLPFEIDPLRLLTPIEREVNSDLHYLAMQMYPQFPILNYFVDFADPYKKFAIEVDSVQFHTDGAKDLQRHNKIEAAGWTLYHITGADSRRYIDKFYALGNKEMLDEDGDTYEYEYTSEFESYRDEILINSSSGIVCCIKRKHHPNRRNFEVFYLPKDGDVDYLIYEIRNNFIIRCNELITAKGK